MIDDSAAAASEPRTVVATPPAAVPRTAGAGRWIGLVAVLVALLAIVAVALAWRAEQRGRGTERELVKRQQDSGERVAEALLLAKQSQDAMREATAKVAILEQRLNEVSVQRVQLEDLMQSLARSRDENLVAEIDSAMRAAAQQAALTGSVEPLVATLRQSDERIARANQPRLDGVRRAIAHDLEKARAASVADAASLSIRIDEAVRLVDDLPLIASAELRRETIRQTVRDKAGEPRRDATGEPIADRPNIDAAAATAAAAPAPEPAASGADLGDWIAREFGATSRRVLDSVWTDVRSLVRVTRIDRPEAMLVSPEQGFFLRENLKLRLLNARLAVLSRQFDAAQNDLKVSQTSVDRYFDRSAKRTQNLAELLRQISKQAQQSGVPRPDETLTALAALSAAPR